MKKSRFTETQIVSILKEADSGIKVSDLCRQHGISQPTYYQWKSKYGGLSASVERTHTRIIQKISAF
jgi:putative transposase